MYSYCQCNFVTADGAPGGGARHGRANKEQTTWSGHWVLSMMKLTVTQTLGHASCLTPAHRAGAWWRHTLLLTSHTFPSHKRLLSSDQRSGPRPLLGPLHSSDRRFPGANIHSANPGIWSQNSVPCVRTTNSVAVKFSRFHPMFGHVCADQKMDDCSFQLWASLLRVTFSVGSCEEPGIALWPSHEAFQHDQQHSGWSYVSSVTQGLIITQSHITAGRGLQVHNLCFVIWMRKWNILKYYETAQKNIIFHHPDKIFDHTVIKLQSWEIVELAFYVKYSHS